VTCDDLCDLARIYAALKGFAMVMGAKDQFRAEDNGLSRKLEAFTEDTGMWQNCSVLGRFHPRSVNSLDNRFV
jgi:hypothetical protein